MSSGSTSPYQFIGVDQIQNGISVVSGYGFNSAVSGTGVTCIGQGCPTSCVSAQTCTSNGGTLQGSYCYICGPNQIGSGGQCIPTTITCPGNQYYNGTACVCNNGYVMVNGVCYVICAPNAYIFNSVCQCLPGFTLSNLGTCLPTSSCPTNFIRSNGNCICPSPFGLLNSQCVACPAYSYVNNTGYCTCNPGYTLNPSTYRCEISCMTNAYRNSLGQCVCIDGYYNQGNLCVPQGSCTNGKTWNGTDCSCPTGMVVDSITTLCTYCNTPDRTVSNNRCVCSATYYPTINSCNPCMANAVYSVSAATCVCNSNYQMVNGFCVFQGNCPFNSNYNPATQSCVCVQAGQYVINGYCQACPQYSTWNGTDCKCNIGYSPSNGLCIPNCGPNQNYNGQSCVCNTNYFIISGTCQLCDPHTTYSNTLYTCVCNPGYYGSWNQCYTCHPSCATCSGPANSQCLTCPSTSTFSNGYCTLGCSAGFYPSAGQCYQCSFSCATCSGAGSTSCTSCTAPATLNSGSCIIPCPAGTYLSGTSCLACTSPCLTCSGAGTSSCTSCTSPAILQAGSCITCAAKTYPSGNACLQCDSSCATCNGAGTTSCTSCTSPAALQSGACIVTCSSGTYPSGNSCLQCDASCVTCSGAGNNKCTSCKTGISLNNGVCMGVCGIGSFVNNAGNCVSCLPNCGVCSSTSTCTACLLGYTLDLQISGSTVTSTCVATTPGASSPIAFRSGVLGASGTTLLIYQGVTMANLPTGILSAPTSSTILNNLFVVNINSMFAAITYTQQFIPNTQYWFVITFNFGAAQTIPSFQFTVRINPIYASYFTNIDMQQSLTGSYSNDYFSATTPLLGTTSTTTGTTTS